MNMNKQLIVLSFAIAFSTLSFGQSDNPQNKKNEFRIGYGILPSTSHEFMFFLSMPHFDDTRDRIGAVSATYSRRVSKITSIGLTVCYDPVRITYYDKIAGERATICKVKEDCVSVMPHLKLNWWKGTKVNYYSKIAGIIGMCYLNYRQEEYHPDLYAVIQPEDFSQLIPAMHFTFLGIDYETGHYIGYLQLGMGMEGLVSMGLRYEF